MRSGISRVAVLAAAILAAGVSFAEDNVLYWMVGDNATVNGTNIRDFFDNFLASVEGAGNTFAARVRVTGGNLAEPKYLDLYIPGSGIATGDGELGVDFSDGSGGSGYWGAGVPTGNQSPFVVDGLDVGSAEYSFAVELGNFDSSYNWTTIAESASVAYNALGAYTHETFDMNPSSLAVWTMDTFTEVPEPSSGLLLLIGGGLLALRRRRRS